MRPTRREAMRALAASAAVALSWPRAEGEVVSSVPRVRMGGRVDLRCPGATGFALRSPTQIRQIGADPSGRASFVAPAFDLGPTWTAIECLPLGVDKKPATVLVLTEPPSFGL